MIFLLIIVIILTNVAWAVNNVHLSLKLRGEAKRQVEKAWDSGYQAALGPPEPKESESPEAKYGHPKPVIDTIRAALPELRTDLSYEIWISDAIGRKQLSVAVVDTTKPLEKPNSRGGLWTPVIHGVIGITERTTVANKLASDTTYRLYEVDWKTLYGVIKNKAEVANQFDTYLVDPMVKFIHEQLLAKKLYLTAIVEHRHG